MHHLENQVLVMVLLVVVEAQQVVVMEHQVVVEAQPVVDMGLLVVVEAQSVVDTVLPLVDQVLLVLDTVLLVEGEVLVVVDMVDHQMIKTANKYPDKTAKVFLSKYQDSKGQENKEQFVKWPTHVVEETIIMEVVVYLVGCLIMEIMETMEIVEGQDVMEGEEVVPMEVVEEEEDLHTQGNRRQH